MNTFLGFPINPRLRGNNEAGGGKGAQNKRALPFAIKTGLKNPAYG